MTELGARIRAGRSVEAAAAELIRIAAALEPQVLGDEPPPVDPAHAYWLAAQTLAGLPEESRPGGIDPVELLHKASRAGSFLGPDQEAWPLYLAGVELRDAGRLGESRELLRDTIERSGGAAYTLPWLRITLAQMEKDRGSLAEALALAEQAERDLERIEPAWPDRDRLACEVQGVLGETHLALGLLDRAAVFVGSEQAIAARTGDARSIAKSHVRTADLYLALRRFETACRHVDEALETEALRALPGLASELVLRRGIANASHGRRERELDELAERDLRDVLRRPSLPRSKALQARLWLAVVLLRQERWDEARETLLAARAGLEDARRTEETALAFPGAMLAALETQLLLSLDPDERTLLAQLADLERDFDRFLAHWRTVPARPGGVGFLHFGMRRHVLSALIELTLRVRPGADGVAAALDHVHRAQALGSAARAAVYEPVPLGELVERLTDEARGVLVYVPGPEGSHVFALDRRGPVHARTGTKGDIDDVRERFVALISARPEADEAQGARELHEAAASLARILLPDAIRERMQSWTAVSVVGLDVLGYVPFEYLPWSDGRWLGEALAVGYLPSLPFGVLLQERPAPPAAEAGTDLFLLAAPAVSERVSEQWPKATRIPFDREDEERLTAAFDRARVEVVTGLRATPQSLSSPTLATTRVLQVLAHGVYVPDVEQGAALALAPRDEGDDGLLLSESVHELPYVPPLVVLTSCESARGPLRRGEDGVAGIGGAFLSAGARAVVLSPNRLELHALHELMPVFYERLVAHGDSPAEALRRARLELATSPGRSHPFYGLIHVVGLGHEPLFPGRR